MAGSDYLVAIDYRDKDQFIIPDRDWAKAQSGVEFCTWCRTVLRDRFPMPIHAVMSPEQTGFSYGPLWRASVGVISYSLLGVLSDALASFAVGKCFSPDKELISGYGTIYSATTLVLRGDSRTNYTVCPKCSRVFGLSWAPYVLRSELGSGLAFQDASSWLYLHCSLAASIDWKQFHDLELSTVPIRDAPLSDDPFPKGAFHAGCIYDADAGETL